MRLQSPRGRSWPCVERADADAFLACHVNVAELAERSPKGRREILAMLEGLKPAIGADWGAALGFYERTLAEAAVGFTAL